MAHVNPHEPQHDPHATAAYNRMLERVKSALDATGQRTASNVRHGIEAAVDLAEQLGELTRSEAEKIAAYVQRDLHDAGEYLATTGRDLRSWLRFDVELIEDRLLDLFSAVADRTRLEWLDLEWRGQLGPAYRSGEITGPGTLLCTTCGHELQFQATGHIPPCPKCHGTTFARAAQSDQGIQ